MHSPFPGMNPYLEQYWGDIHQRLIIYSSDALQKQLPGDLRARVNRARVTSSPRMESRATSSLTSGSLSEEGATSPVRDQATELRSPSR